MSREFDRERGKVSPADEKRRVSALAKLLRAELREARFSGQPHGFGEAAIVS